MHNRDGVARHRASVNVSIAEVNVRIEAPVSVRAVLDAMLAVVPRFDDGVFPDVTISAQASEDVWKIEGLAGSLKVLDAQSALPRIGGAIMTSALRDVATSLNYRTLRATVMACEGRALAIMGDDWESGITLSAHLHSRGWAYLGSDNALLNPRTLEVLPVQKSLYVNSSALAHFPLQYRRAVEASPWYVTPQGISFYAVDPRMAGCRQTWAVQAVLSGVIVIDGATSDRPSLESFENVAFDSERFTRFDIDWSRLPAMDLKLGPFCDTCDIIEHWFGSLQ